MFLRQLQIEQFRNFFKLEIDFPEQCNLFYGNNGQGKTNLLEAIYFLATTKSFKNSQNRDIIRRGCDVGRINGNIAYGLEKDAIYKQLSVSIRPGVGGDLRKVVQVNGADEKLFDYFSRIKVLSITSEDDQILLGGPEFRRRFLDRSIFNIYPRYLQFVKEYQHLLREKNLLLKQRSVDRRMLSTWNLRMAEPGAKMVCARLKWVRRVASRVARYYQEISGETLTDQGKIQDGIVSLHYRSSFGYRAEPQEKEDVCEAFFLKKLEENLAREIEQRQSFLGPHRDELEIYISGFKARAFASRGEIKTLLCALKLAELEEIALCTKIVPFFLVDDIGQELDTKRLRFLLNVLSKHRGQVFLTTPTLDLIPLDLLPEAFLFEVKAGTVQAFNRA